MFLSTRLSPKSDNMQTAFIAATPITFSTHSRVASREGLLRQQTVGTQRATPRRHSARMSANTPSPSSEVIGGPFEGRYGTWYLTQGEADGVLQYRLALAAMAATSVVATGTALTLGTNAPGHTYDALFLLSTAAFGVALQKIHIYVKPLHNALKVLWALGVCGALSLTVLPSAPADGVVLAAYAHPALLLAIGWQFVALSGLFIKEAICFGRAEAIALFALVPLLTGGHFLGVVGPSVEQTLTIAFTGLFAVFAARKFSQPATDDIGDLSVFEHLAKGGEL